MKLFVAIAVAFLATCSKGESNNATARGKVEVGAPAPTFLSIGVPATYLIDREGILRWRKTGPIAPKDSALAAAIERALGS